MLAGGRGGVVDDHPCGGLKLRRGVLVASNAPVERAHLPQRCHTWITPGTRLHAVRCTATPTRGSRLASAVRLAVVSKRVEELALPAQHEDHPAPMIAFHGCTWSRWRSSSATTTRQSASSWTFSASSSSRTPCR